MAVKALHALQNGFIGFERSGLFYGEFSAERVQIPIACWLVQTADGNILFDTGLSPRAVPGLVRNDPLARFTDRDLLVHRLDALGLETSDIDVVVLSHLHYDHAGGTALFAAKSELVVQQDEYAFAHYPSAFFAPLYYRKNFDLPGARWRLLDGDTELAPGVTALRTDGHTPGHQSLYVEFRVPGVVWNPTLAQHSIQRLKTLARLTGAQVFPGHDPEFWATVRQAPDAYR
jgi:N-acyl homoserine lactone hydrolase